MMKLTKLFLKENDGGKRTYLNQFTDLLKSFFVNFT